MSMPHVWSIMEDTLFLTQKCFDIKIHSFVLMSNHYHMILSAPQKNLSLAVGRFAQQTSLTIVKATGRINNLWAQRFHRCEITSLHYFYNAYKYVYQNPVRASICEKVEDYPYSTLHGLLGRAKLLVPVSDDAILFDGDFNKNLDWLNARPSDENSDAIRRGLRRQKFTLPKINSRLHPLERDLL